MRETKQVIVVRTDLNMPVGKIAAQVAHASCAFLTYKQVLYNTDILSADKTQLKNFVKYFSGEFADEVDQWIRNDYTKICLGVGSYDELIDIHEKCLDVGLSSHLIIDDGKTCFNGKHTATCVGIGPHYVDKFQITKHLKLL